MWKKNVIAFRYCEFEFLCKNKHTLNDTILMSNITVFRPMDLYHNVYFIISLINQKNLSTGCISFYFAFHSHAVFDSTVCTSPGDIFSSS